MVHKILLKLEPTLFQDEETQKISEEVLTYFLCRLVGAQKNTLLPTLTHEVEATVESLTAALSQHYTAIGGLVGPKTLENLRQGYFTKGEDGKTVTCTLDQKEEKTKLNFDYADEVIIAEPMDVGTMLCVSTNGRDMKIDCLGQEFKDANVELPGLEVEWQGELFGAKKAVRTPEKRKSIDKDSSSQASNVFASKSSVMLGDALRRKLARKAPEKKDAPASASSAGSKGR